MTIMQYKTLSLVQIQQSHFYSENIYYLTKNVSSSTKITIMLNASILSKLNRFIFTRLCTIGMSSVK